MLFVSYTGSYDEASNLVKIHKKRKKSSQKTDAFSMEVRDDEAKSYVKSAMLGLSTGKVQCLITALLISKTGRHFHRLYPKLFGSDVKFRVNTEERSLFRSCGRNVSGKNLPDVNSFFSSQQL